MRDALELELGRSLRLRHRLRHIRIGRGHSSLEGEGGRETGPGMGRATEGKERDYMEGRIRELGRQLHRAG